MRSPEGWSRCVKYVYNIHASVTCLWMCAYVAARFLLPRHITFALSWKCSILRTWSCSLFSHQLISHLFRLNFTYWQIISMGNDEWEWNEERIDVHITYLRFIGSPFHLSDWHSIFVAVYEIEWWDFRGLFLPSPRSIRGNWERIVCVRDKLRMEIIYQMICVLDAMRSHTWCHRRRCGGILHNL